MKKDKVLNEILQQQLNRLTVIDVIQYVQAKIRNSNHMAGSIIRSHKSLKINLIIFYYNK
jgi:hypothetical protein